MSLLAKFLFVFLLPISVLHGQNDSIQRKVKSVIVYKGCENEKTNNDLQKCFYNKFTKIIESKFTEHSEKLLDLKLKEFSAKIKFAVSRTGNIENVEYLDVSNPIFGDLLKQSFQNMVAELNEIKPAIDYDNNPVSLIFTIPLKWTFEEYYFWVDENMLFRKNPQYKELVYYLLKSDNKTYEIRITRDYQFNIYEKLEQKYIYLGKAMNLYEVETMEPYKNIIEKMKDGKKLLKGEGVLDGENYQIFLNLNNDEWEIYKNKILIESLKGVNKLGKSQYAELIFRG